ncbi:helix-turn-helix domain-containing protein [Brevibacillus sp. GCM10020057]|uniref:helix-turn-helix domain-containing protein n=1 Tax=Brevibacillus sp. GCM10020057 TaxID=3317327 RepID=UPI003634EC5A
MDTDLGKLIRSLRVGQKKTLRQISEKTELSISFLSQVERGKSSITLESLKKISEALDVSPSYFFPDRSEQTKASLRRGSDAPARDHSAPFVYEDLSGDLSNPAMKPTLVTLQPHDEKGAPFVHRGQEFVYVLEGVLTLLLSGEEYELYPGDSIHMDSSAPRHWLNRTGERVRFLCVNARGK